MRDAARDEVAATFLAPFGAFVVGLALRVGVLLADSLRAGTRGSNDGIVVAVLRLALVEVGNAEVTPVAFSVLVTITSVRPGAKTKVSGMLVVVVGVLDEDAGAGFPTGTGGESGGSLTDVCPGGGVYTYTGTVRAGALVVGGAVVVCALVVGGVVVVGAEVVAGAVVVAGALVVDGAVVAGALVVGAVVVVGGADVGLLGVSEVDVVEGMDDVVTVGATELVGSIVLTTPGTVSTLVEGAGAAVLLVVLGGISDVVVDVPKVVVVELDDVVVAGAGPVAVAAYTSSSRMIAGP